MPAAETVLVTGGAGYIGSHACKSLAGAGYTPVTYDNLSTGHEWAVQWGPLERGDVLDGARLAEVMARYRPVALMHFAALSLVGESMSNPEKYYTNNVVGSLSLIKAMLAGGVDTLVFSSTCAVYGEPRRVPIPEDHPAAPINPYGHTKLAVENMLRDFSLGGGLRYLALRYFNAAGADPEVRIGECHAPETHLVPLVMAAAAGGAPVKVLGTDYDTPDGTAVRDYIHVDDIADAHLLALESLRDGGASGCLNLGTGTGSSVREIIRALERVSGRAVPAIDAPRRPGDPPRLVAEPSPRLAALGWRPAYATVDGIIETAWRWHRARG